MSSRVTLRLLVVVACLASAGGNAAAQGAETAQVAVHAQRDGRPDRTTPGSRRLNRREVVSTAVLSVGTAAPTMATVGALGSLIGYFPCLNHHEGPDSDGIFAPVGCFANDAFVYGVYAGSFAGAAAGAAGGGIRAGCGRGASFARGFVGALAGSLPGIVYVVSGGSESVAVANAITVGTPVLQVAGATAAVSRCRVASTR